MGTQGVQEFFFCELKAPGGSKTLWALNSYEKINLTSLFGYDARILHLSIKVDQWLCLLELHETVSSQTA